MILADTSVWVDHLRAGHGLLRERLAQRLVLMHPYVEGELALGRIPRREHVLADLTLLPRAALASHEEVMEMIGALRLPGCGIGYVDAHLLAATRLTPGARLWTYDQFLARVAAAAGLGYSPAVQ